MGKTDWLKHLTGLWKEFKKRAETIRKKDETIKKLKKALELKGNMQCKHSAYWLKDDQGKIIEGPFCTDCFDNEHTTRRLVPGGRPNGQVGKNWAWVKCPKCNIPFRSERVGVFLNTH